MLVNDKDAAARLLSSSNLINKIKNKTIGSSRADTMALFGMSQATPGSGSKTNEKLASDSSPRPEIRYAGDIPGYTPLSDNVDDSSGDTDTPSSDSEIALLPSVVPIQQPTAGVPAPGIDDLLENADGQIKLKTAHDSALGVINSALNRMKNDVDTININKLPAVLTAAQKVVESIRKEKIDMNRNDGDRQIHYHFYTPEQKKLANFEVIDVG